MEHTLLATVAASIIGSNGLFLFLQFLITRHDGKKGWKNTVSRELAELKHCTGSTAKEVDKIVSRSEEAEETSRVILHDRIWQMYRYLLPQDEISVEDKANLDYMFGEYSKLGGNHKAEIMYNEIRKKPVKRAEGGTL